MNLKKQYRNKLIKWSSEPDGDVFLLIDRNVSFLSDYLYFDYEPCSGGEDFHSRLARWLDNLRDDYSQKLLLRLVPHILYLGKEEFDCLYKTAYSSNIINWLVDQTVSNFETDNYQEILDRELQRSWFCPMSDSFQINRFFKINNIPTKNTFRPDWRSLSKLGDIDLIIKHINDNQIKYLIILEDFVGSGSQIRDTLKFIYEKILSNSSIFNELKLLFVPLLTCPKGYDNSLAISNEYQNVFFFSSIRNKGKRIAK